LLNTLLVNEYKNIYKYLEMIKLFQIEPCLYLVGVTHVIPVVEGYVIGSSIKHIPIAGRDITLFVQQLLREREPQIPPEVFATCMIVHVVNIIITQYELLLYLKFYITF
jgi:hypothetical protein